MEHVYTSWPGTKTVIAQGIPGGQGDCDGSARVNVLITPPLAIAFAAPTSAACGLVPNEPKLLSGWHVHITTNSDPAAKIDFGCALGGCRYDAHGEPNSVAPSEYPFPGLRKYSLVIRIGPQIVQGDTEVNFIVDQVGAMELCVNDNDLSGNSHGWGIFIDVNT